MKKSFIVLALCFMLTHAVNGQMIIYPVTTWEIIFNPSSVEADLGDGPQHITTNMRFTGFFNWGQNLHFDFNDKFGFYTGLAFRNIGIIVDDPRYNDMTSVDYYKVKRRTYTLGLPVAIKIGNFNRNMYLFAGGEIEMLFHYKEKYWVSGVKYKSKEWFSNKTERWNPSVFVGIQFPGGFNVKYKYYFNDFLNHDYHDSMYDFTSLRETSIWYISVGWQFRTRRAEKIVKRDYQMALR